MSRRGTGRGRGRPRQNEESSDAGISVRQEREPSAGDATPDDGQKRPSFELWPEQPEGGADGQHVVQRERGPGGQGSARQEARPREVEPAKAVSVGGWPRRIVINGRLHMCKNQREADDIAFKQSMGWPV